MSKRDKNLDLDSIGKLPDCVLHHIVYLLPYKEAARTVVLSKRWHRVLPSSRIVNFEERELGFLVQREGGFVDFAENLVKNYQDSTMDKFSITFSISSPREFPEELRNCIAFAVEKKAKAILLDFSGQNREAKFGLPEVVYGHKTLETLRLFSCDLIGSRFKNFDSLLHLSLGWVELSSASLRALVENCASLESLSLKKCWNTDVIEVKGRGLRLESLVIDDCDVIHDWIAIAAPNLKFFKYLGKFRNFELDWIQKLEEASIDFGAQSEFGEVGDLLFVLFRDLYAVKVLTVCSFVLQIIPLGEEPLRLKPRLDRVKHLILKTAMHENEFYGIRFFLNSCPFLETLTIEINLTRTIFEEYECPFKDSGYRSMPVYTCVKRTLKAIDVKGFRGNFEEITLLAYFVSAGRAMKNLKIKVGVDSQICLQKARILLNVKKASPNLLISIS